MSFDRVQVGDVWRSPRGRFFVIDRFDKPAALSDCVVLTEDGTEERAWSSLITPANGWHLFSRKGSASS